MIRGNLMAPIFREYHFTKVPAAGAVPKPKVTVCAYIERNPGKLSHGQDEKLKFSKKNILGRQFSCHTKKFGASSQLASTVIN